MGVQDIQGIEITMRSSKTFFLIFLLVLVLPIQAQDPAADTTIYDLLLKNGHVIDIKNNRNGRFDIAVIGEKIHTVAENLPAYRAKKVVDVSE